MNEAQLGAKQCREIILQKCVSPFGESACSIRLRLNCSTDYTSYVCHRVAGEVRRHCPHSIRLGNKAKQSVTSELIRALNSLGSLMS